MTNSITKHGNFEIKRNFNNQAYFDIFANLFAKATEQREQARESIQQEQSPSQKSLHSESEILCNKLYVLGLRM